MTVFMKIRLEIRKLEAENTLPEYRKPRFDSKLFFLKKKTLLLMVTNQNKAMFIFFTNQSKVLYIKIM